MRILLAGLSFFVCGGVVAAMLTTAIFMVVAGEPPQLTTVLIMAVPFLLAAVVMFIGLGARGRGKARQAGVVAARVLLTLGFLAGVAFGIWGGHGEIEQRRNIDEGTCHDFLGDGATNAAVARCLPIATSCRRDLGDAEIAIERGKTRPDGWPEGLHMPKANGVARAQIKCVYDRVRSR